MKMLSYSQFTDKGHREINEDCAAVVEKDNARCFILCDGLGGHGKGELASACVVDSIKESFMDCTDYTKFLEYAMLTAQQKLLSEQKRLNAPFEMKTTSTVLLIWDDNFQYAHVGDSRVYVFNKGKYSVRTLDHSVPQMLALAGDIKDKNIRKHPDRNRLLRVMGIEWESPRFEISKAEKLDERKAFLLCSDGFWELINEKKMSSMLKKSKGADQWLESMTKYVVEAGNGTNMDNYTAIAVKME